MEKLIFDAGGEADREVEGVRLRGRGEVTSGRKMAGWGSRAGV